MRSVNTGCVLLALSAGGPQSAATLGRACETTSLETERLLQSLVRHGFVVIAGDAETGPVYRLARIALNNGHREGGQRILLIEDDPGILEFMTVLLESEGHIVVVAQTPSDGMRLLDDVRFDLVMTDGFSRIPAGVLAATAGVVRAAGSTPVVLFTAHALEREIVQAMGFRDLIEKPFDLEAVLEQISALLQPRVLCFAAYSAGRVSAPPPRGSTSATRRGVGETPARVLRPTRSESYINQPGHGEDLWR